MSDKQKNMGAVTNPKLREAMAALKKAQTQENQDALFKELRQAKLLAPALFDVQFKPDKFGRIQMPKNAKIKFVLVNTKEGKTFFPAFTDLDEAKKLKITQPGNLQNIVRTVKDYAQMTANEKGNTEGIVINPMSDNIVLPASLLQALAGNGEVKPMTNSVPPANVIYSEPTVYPTQMVNAVHDACKEIEGINRVWLKSMLMGPAMSFLLIVDAEKPTAELFEKIKAAAEPLSKNIPVEVTKYTEELEKKAVKGDFPLFDKDLDL